MPLELIGLADSQTPYPFLRPSVNFGTHTSLFSSGSDGAFYAAVARARILLALHGTFSRVFSRTRPAQYRSPQRWQNLARAVGTFTEPLQTGVSVFSEEVLFNLQIF